MSNDSKKLTRREDWPKVLHAFVEEYRRKDFEWGKTDCCLMVGDWIERCTGEDLGHYFKGKYTTAMGAFKLLREFSDGKIEEAFRKIAEEWSMQEKHPGKAQRGDVVIINAKNYNEEWESVAGICIGYYSMTLLPTRGITLFTINAITHCWRV